MQRILLVQTSSMGDVIHNLPVVSDLATRFQQAQIDWVVEESFAAVPRLHAMVRKVYPVAIRRWRSAPMSAETWREVGEFRRQVGAQPYDAIIDTQGLVKSALLVACARGPKYGLDWASSREPIGWFYDRTFAIPWDRHAVERNRALALVRYGATLRTLGKVDEGRKVIDEAVAVLGKLREQGDTSEGATIGLATGLITQSRLMTSLNQDSDALAVSTRAVELIRPAAAAPNASPMLRRAAGDVLNVYGYLLMVARKQDAAIAALLHAARAADRDHLPDSRARRAGAEGPRCGLGACQRRWRRPGPPAPAPDRHRRRAAP